MEEFLSIFYKGMIAEESRKNTILKKRVKRLGIHHLLIDDIPAATVAHFSKGVKWQNLDRLKRAKGF